MRKEIILSLIVITALFASCRKPYACQCTVYQPNINPVTTTEMIDNTQAKANITCNENQLTVVNTATTVCDLQY